MATTGTWAAACEGRPYFAHAAEDLPSLGISPLAAFAHGSRVYGTDGPASDRDHEVIVPDGSWEGSEQVEVGSPSEGEVRQYTIIPASRWEREAAACSVLFCECAFLPDELVAGEHLVPDGWIPDMEKVRRQFSRTASNSWVKCKKKLIVPESYDPYVAKKSLWHSLRILMFGTQIVEAGRIADYAEANGLYAEIMACPDDWDELDRRYRPVRNGLRSRFRSHDGDLGIVRSGGQAT